MMWAGISVLKSNHTVGIVDNAENPGKFLIKELIKLNNSSAEIHIFCYDQYYLEMEKELGIIRTPNVLFYDCFPDLNATEFSDPFEAFASSMKTYKCSSQKLIIVVDSLSTYLLGQNFENVYRRLHRLNSENIGGKIQIQIVIIIHEDTVQDLNFVSSYLRHLCRAWILVKPNTVTVSARRSTGKVYVESFNYEYDRSNKQIITKKNHVFGDDIENNENQPLSTFRLTLSESEKKARDAVKLPYERNECDDNNAKGGEVFYEPDEYDDWDEEDPDNDLEFS